jgi:hypothetical protein
MITLQAQYIVWRDAAMAAVVEMRGGGGPGRGKKAPAELRVLLPDDDPGQDVADRWRKDLCDKAQTGEKPNERI